MSSYVWLNRPVEHHKSNQRDREEILSPLNRHEFEQPLISFVLLLEQPRHLNAAQLAHGVSAAFGFPVGTGPTRQRASVAGESPCFLLRLPDGLFSVHAVAHPYFDNPTAVVADLTELRSRRAVAFHRAWLAVDCLHNPVEGSHSYATVGRLAAMLAERDCLAVCLPARHHLVAFDENVMRQLCAADPLRALEANHRASRPGVSPNDPRYREAVREARRRWSEFVAAFETRQEGQIFSAKLPIRQGRTTRSLWVAVSALENDRIYADLDSIPLTRNRRQPGMWTSVPVGELQDWLYTDGERLVGGFTLDVGRRPRFSEPS